MVTFKIYAIIKTVYYSIGYHDDLMEIVTERVFLEINLYQKILKVYIECFERTSAVNCKKAYSVMIKAF